MNADLLHLIDAWASLTVLVIGDAMLDCYLSGSADRLCQEAPVPVVAVRQRQELPGGAAHTAASITSLGATARLLAVIGNDGEGDRLQQILTQQGIATPPLLVSSHRKTLTKQRVIAGNQLVVRFDQGSEDAIAPDLEQTLRERLQHLVPQCDAVIVSDYGYGILTPRLIQTLAELQAQHPRTLLVDSKQLLAYRMVGATVVKPNYSEAMRLLGLPKQHAGRADQIASHGDRLLHLTGAAIVAVTLDQEGAILFEHGKPPCRTAARPVPAHQTVGAGDTYGSVLTLALAAGASTATAASLATAATALAIAQPGTTPCTKEALRQSIYVHR